MINPERTGEQTGVDTLPIVAGQVPTQIATRAMTAARLGGYDVVMLDTAGRLAIDEDRAVASLGSQAEQSFGASLALDQIIYSEPVFANVTVQKRLQQSLEVVHSLGELVLLLGLAAISLPEKKPFPRRRTRSLGSWPCSARTTLTRPWTPRASTACSTAPGSASCPSAVWEP